MIVHRIANEKHAQVQALIVARNAVKAVRIAQLMILINVLAVMRVIQFKVHCIYANFVKTQYKTVRDVISRQYLQIVMNVKKDTFQINSRMHVHHVKALLVIVVTAIKPMTQLLATPTNKIIYFLIINALYAVQLTVHYVIILELNASNVRMDCLLTKTKVVDQCLKCQDNYINKISYCVKNCNEEIQNCVTCNSSQCIQCNQDFLLFEGKCAKSYPVDSYIWQNMECKKCDQIFDNCEKCQKDLCIKCKQDLELIQQCPTCYQIEHCIQCQINITQQNICVSKCDEKQKTSEKCEEEYKLENGKCIEIQTDEEEEISKYDQIPKSLAQFQLTGTEQKLYESTSTVQDTALAVGVVCSSVLTVVLGSSGASFAG